MDQANDALRPELLEELEGFLRTHLKDTLGEFAQDYPSNHSITIDWHTLYKWNAGFAEDYLTHRTYIHRHLVQALKDYDYPIPLSFEDSPDPVVYVTNLNEEQVYDPTQIEKIEPGEYIGIRGTLSKISEPTDKVVTAHFHCERCDTLNIVEQADELQEPYQCEACERQGPFEINADASEWVKHAKIRIETPPDESGELQNQYVDGFVDGPLVWEGHPEYGILARSGEPVTVYGEIVRRQEDKKSNTFKRYLDVAGIRFEDDVNAVDIEAHREAFMEYASRDDAVDVLAQSLAPQLFETPAWETALELLVAYLFGAPRIEGPNGESFRGDIHCLIISGYGMGKSMVNSAVANYSPNAIKESATGMSSDVALLAAAVEDDFAGGGWSLEPGILVRANNGHVILDEIDKTDADLERMNDALEGDQLVTVNKAGQNATYKSRTGLLGTGNPEGSRFNPHDAISEQLGIDESLLSRFDGIITMKDKPDEEIDSGVAETQGKSVLELQEYDRGEREEFDQLSRVVSPEVGRAWIQYARENVRPKIQPGHIERIREWYAQDVRKLNEKFESNEGVGADMPVPANPRMVKAVIRFSVAFARANLRDEVTDTDLDRALSLAKALVGQRFDGEKFSPHESRSVGLSGNAEIDDAIRDTIEDLAENGSGAGKDDVIERVASRGASESRVRKRVGRLKDAGVLMEPEVGSLRVT